MTDEAESSASPKKAASEVEGPRNVVSATAHATNQAQTSTTSSTSKPPVMDEEEAAMNANSQASNTTETPSKKRGWRAQNPGGQNHGPLAKKAKSGKGEWFTDKKDKIKGKGKGKDVEKNGEAGEGEGDVEEGDEDGEGKKRLPKKRVAVLLG